MNYAVSNEELAGLGEAIVANSGGAATGFKVAYGELTIEGVAHRIRELMTQLKDDAACRFVQLIDIAGVDYPDRAKRFDVVYHLLSFAKNRRVRVKVQAEEGEAVPSAIAVHPSANWFEREAFDMYGIVFDGHPDLRRLLTDYGFVGYPLRKDFPMTGYVEVRYDDEQKRVVYEPVKLTQEFRQFDFLSPWEGDRRQMPGQGYPYVLPGDEKAKS